MGSGASKVMYAAYPLHRARGSRYRAFPRVRFGPTYDPPLRTITYAAKLTPARPFVKRGSVSKSLFLTRESMLAHFFTSV
jgi:hypothetical protein